MAALSQEETNRIQPLLLEDERKRDRKHFAYAFDILKRNWVCAYSIWSMPNADIIRIIKGEIGYNDLPFEDLNEFEKGIFFEEQKQFVEQYASTASQILCEARAHGPCLQEKCQIFRPRTREAGGLFGICSEYKIVFKKA